MRLLQTYYVTGIGVFPIDMLRTEHCWPASQDAVVQIIVAVSGRREQWRVDLSRYVDRENDLPSFARWASFGCDVEIHSMKTRKVRDAE